MKAFMSYSSKNKLHVDIVDDLLIKFGIKATRDNRDLYPLGELVSFMESINNAEKAILFISETYLKSRNCLTELFSVFEKENYLQKIVPIIMPNTEIWDIEAQVDYLKFWENKYVSSNTKIKELDSIAYTTSIIEQLESIEEIRRKLDKVFNVLRNHLCLKFNEIQENNFLQLLEMFNVFPNDDEIKWIRIFLKNRTSNDYLSSSEDYIFSVLKRIFTQLNTEKTDYLSILETLTLISNDIYNAFSLDNKYGLVEIKHIFQYKGNPSLLTLVRDNVRRHNDRIQYESIECEEYRIHIKDLNEPIIYYSKEIENKIVFMTFPIYKKIDRNQIIIYGFLRVEGIDCGLIKEKEIYKLKSIAESLSLLMSIIDKNLKNSLPIKNYLKYW